MIITDEYRERFEKSASPAEVLPQTAEEFDAAIDSVVEATIATTVEAFHERGLLRDADEEVDAEEIAKAEGPDAVAVMARLVDNAMASGAVSKQQAVVAVSKQHRGLAARAYEAAPEQRYGHKPETEAIAKREAEQHPDAAHEVSDKWRREQREHDAAATAFARRCRQIVQDSAATSRPLTYQQASLIVARADSALYSKVRTMPSHD